jgi:hypothetical protein
MKFETGDYSALFSAFAKFILDDSIFKADDGFFSTLQEIDVLSYFPVRYQLFYLSAIKAFSRYKHTSEALIAPIYADYLQMYSNGKNTQILVEWEPLKQYLLSYTGSATFESIYAAVKQYLIKQDSLALLSSKLSDVNLKIDFNPFDVFPINAPSLAVKTAATTFSSVDVVAEFRKSIEDSRAGKLETVFTSTGFTELDELLVYKMESGGVSVVSGRQKHGKSTLKMNMIVRQLLMGIPVFSWTPEMKVWKERNTILSILTGLSVQNDIVQYFYNPESVTDEVKDKINTGLNQLAALPYFVSDTYIQNADHFIGVYEQLIKNNGIRVVYLDNADNLREVYTQVNAFEKSARIQATLRRFQEFSVEFKGHVCAMWQLSRDAVDKRDGRVREGNLNAALSFSDTVGQIIDFHFSVNKAPNDTYGGFGGGVTYVRLVDARGGSHVINNVVKFVRDKNGEKLHTEAEIELSIRVSSVERASEESVEPEPIKPEIENPFKVNGEEIQPEIGETWEQQREKFKNLNGEYYNTILANINAGSYTVSSLLLLFQSDKALWLVQRYKKMYNKSLLIELVDGLPIFDLYLILDSFQIVNIEKKSNPKWENIEAVVKRKWGLTALNLLKTKMVQLGYIENVEIESEQEGSVAVGKSLFGQVIE